MRRLSGPLIAALPALTLGFGAVHDAAGSSVVHVRASGGSDANNGADWASAVATLQRAIELASNGATIHVALGTYTPTALLDPTEPRSATFAIVEDKQLLILGGYPATGDDFENRSPADFPTILTGDLAGDDVANIPITQAENAFHIVYFEDCRDIAQLDGFVIQAGRALEETSSPPTEAQGGGILAFQTAAGEDCDPVIQNCVIRNNRAYRGGGVAILAIGPNAADAVPSPSIRTTSFLDNTANRRGGGLWAEAAHPEILGSLFVGNAATGAGFGGGVAIQFANGAPMPRLVNCTIVRNSVGADSGGGIGLEGFLNSPVLVDSCVVVGNTAVGASADILAAQVFFDSFVAPTIRFSAGPAFVSNFPSAGNINLVSADMPFTFVSPGSSPPSAGNYRLRPGSLLLDAGNDNETLLPTDDYDANSNLVTTGELLPDRDLVDRVLDATGGSMTRVDIGAFEHRYCFGDLSGDGAIEADDLAILLGAWGTSNPIADLDGDEVVGPSDLAILLGLWGPCDYGNAESLAAQSSAGSEDLFGEGLLGVLGFDSAVEFVAWLEELGPDLAEQVAAILNILIEGGAS